MNMRMIPAGLLIALIVGLSSVIGIAAHDSTPEASPAASPAASPVAMSTGAAYMTIANNGDSADRLVAVETDAAGVAEIHEVADVSGVMTMRPLDDGLEIPAGESVELMPGGYHVMMIGLTGDLMPGETFDLTLTFEHAGDVTVTAQIVMGNEKPAEGMAEPVNAGDITVSDVWSRGAPAMSH
ncbi:MAG: copper chaperone PCu(A)C [Thermomicrobiales bacterium]|nr:copper chaperone PCu(A)C [Thermomicrobiales bacterium]